jgi:hypothetical protein
MSSSSLCNKLANSYVSFTICFAFVLGSCFQLKAQPNNRISPLELILWSKHKRQVLRHNMQITQAEAASFWKGYEQLEKERWTLNIERIKLLNLLILLPPEDKKVSAISRKLMLNDLAGKRMYKEYYHEVKRVIKASRATVLVFMEIHFQNMLNARLDSLFTSPARRIQITHLK